MGVENIISAIDRAEEQLFAAIETAMARNIPSDGNVGPPAAVAPAPQAAAAKPAERMNAYDELSARVGLEAQRKKPTKAPASKAPASKAPRRVPRRVIPVEREAQQGRPSTASAAARDVVDLDDDDNEAVYVKSTRGGLKNVVDVDAARNEWKPAMAPARSSLSKRAPVNTISRCEPSKAAALPRIASDGAGRNPASAAVKAERQGKTSAKAPAVGGSKTLVPGPVLKQNQVVGPDRVPGSSIGALASQKSRTPLPAAYASAQASIVPGAPIQGFKPTTLLPPVVPGVTYIPGADAIGTTLPNGFRATPEGLRPVVTLAQRPKAELQLRQTYADKFFFALKARHISDMDAVVEAAITEQQYAQ